MPILKLNLNFALTIRSKFHHFSIQRQTACFVVLQHYNNNLLVISDRNSYIGSTIKEASKNQILSAPIAISPRTDNRVSVPQHSAPRDHCHSNSHPFKFHNFTIIDSAATVSDLKF